MRQISVLLAFTSCVLQAQQGWWVREPIRWLQTNLRETEKIHLDQVETMKFGLIFENRGKGRLAIIPWDIGALYYQHSSDAHAGLLADVIDGLLPKGRQLRTDAHPLVEISLMRQGTRTLVHLINISGHSQTAYFAPILMGPIRLEVDGSFASARTLRKPASLNVTRRGAFTVLVVPSLGIMRSWFWSEAAACGIDPFCRLGANLPSGAQSARQSFSATVPNGRAAARCGPSSWRLAS